jgi:hypothetical protein
MYPMGADSPKLRDFVPVIHPAGRDHDLAKAMGDARAGRWMAMAALLADPVTYGQTRETRTSLLAQVAAGSNAVEQWCAEQPDNYNAALMAARVAAERACQAYAAGVPQAARLARAAEAAIRRVHDVDREDPVPYLAQLALACARREFTDSPWPTCPVRAPWPALFGVWRVGGASREACHRVVTAVSDTPADAQMVARHLAAMPELPAASPISVLPLYALVTVYSHQVRGSVGTFARQLWTSPAARLDLQRSWSWFTAARPADRLVLDESHLAHALWAAGLLDQAAAVFDALGDHGARRPWRQVAEARDPVSELVHARADALRRRERGSRRS